LDEVQINVVIFSRSRCFLNRDLDYNFICKLCPT